MILGHQKQWQYLLKLAELHKLPHAFLFCGPEKLGKKTLSFEFAKHLLGDDITKKEHPDFIFLSPVTKQAEPEKKSIQNHFSPTFARPREEIQISQIRELIWRLSLKPSVSSLKVAVIDQAHSMNQQAQNCFLKTLEEPRGNTLLILITEYPDVLLSTILSRVQKIKFYPVPKKEIFAFVKSFTAGKSDAFGDFLPSKSAQGKKLSEKEIEKMVEISQGKPGVVIDFLNQPQKLKEREILLNEIIQLTKSDLNFRFQYVQKIFQTGDLKEILNVWLLHFRKNLINNLNSQANASALKNLSTILQKIQETLLLISTTNINPKLAIEALMLEF